MTNDEPRNYSRRDYIEYAHPDHSMHSVDYVVLYPEKMIVFCTCHTKLSFPKEWCLGMKMNYNKMIDIFSTRSAVFVEKK